jgi:P-type Ca2+ transporter type 2C
VTREATSAAEERARSTSSTTPGDQVLSLEVDEALAALATTRLGLDATLAAQRRALAGPNALPTFARRSLAREIMAQFANMFVIVLVVASALTYATYLLTTPRDSATLELSIGILCVVVLNALIGFIQEHAAERTSEALQAMVTHTTKVLRAGVLVEVDSEDLVPGDVVVFEAGDAVPADGRVIEAHNLSVELSALTGESRPVGRTTDPASPERPAAEARDGVFMGTTIATGTGKAVVYSTGLATQFGQIYRLTAEQGEVASPLQRQVTDMARRVAAVAIAAGVALFGLRALAGSSLALSFVFALGVMVALVPEGLPATLSVSLAIGVRRMARRHALIRRLAAVEALGSTTVICTDKTGTLTTAEMTLQRIYTWDHVSQVSGVGYGPEGAVQNLDEVREVVRVAALCSDARVLAPSEERGWRILGDTTEGAILVAAAKAGVDLAVEAQRTPRLGVFPFDADRKMMSTIQRVDGHVELYLKGSPEEVLARSVTIAAGSEALALDDGCRARVAAAYDAMAGEGLRVLAVARRTLATDRVTQDEAEDSLTFLGLVGIVDAPRPEVRAAVADCRRAGIRILMVTGDYGLTAEAIARHVGILDAGSARVLTGVQLDALDEDDLAATLRATDQILFARVRPEQKLRIVAALEALGEIVAVTGDGANDAPALKRASVGVAMGVGGTDVARAAAVVVLLDDSFASIAAAVELGRAVYRNIQRFLVYVFCSNIAELAPILVATFVGFPLVPLSALQVLAIDLGTDVLPALALGAERPEADTMSRPPRSPRAHLFSWAVVRRFLFLGTLESLGVVAMFFWKVHSAHLGFADFTASTPAYREALTMTQAGIVVGQFFASFAVRTDRESVFREGVFSNHGLLGAGLVSLGFIAALSYVPTMQAVFHTAALSLVDWVFVVSCGAVVLAGDEARKAFHRRRAARYAALGREA